MLTKKELRNTFIRYTPEITEEIFNKIVDKLNYHKYVWYDNFNSYSDFTERGYIKIDPYADNTMRILGHKNVDEKEIQVSDILGEDWNKSKEWWKSLKKDDCVVCLVNKNSYKENHIYKCNGTFKLNEDYLVFYTYLDSKGSTTNGYNTADNKFRLATPEEAAMYEDAGKPVDVTTYKIPEMVVGNYYRVDEGDFYMIGICESIGDYKRTKATYISLENELPYLGKGFHKSKEWCYSDINRTFKEATPEEKQWLNVCIAEGKFIKREIALKDYDMNGMALKSEKEFVLPEKWCVKVTKENKPILQKYEYCNQSIGYNYTIGGYYGNHMGGSFTIPDNTTEITFDQFKKYVMKESEVIPEYVECIKGHVYYPDTSVMGRTYKVTGEASDSDWYIEYDGKKFPSVSKKRFKPSTKEAYEAQFIGKIRMNNQAIFIENEKQWNYALDIIRKGKNLYEMPNAYDILCMSVEDGTYYPKEWFEKEGYKVISFDQWCEQENIVNPFNKKEMKFEEGKWYKFTTKEGEYQLYIKVDIVTDNSVTFQDRRYICDGEYKLGDSIDIKLIENPVMLTDLSEIQQYLPDGHPDKLKEGDYLYVLEGLLEKEPHKHHCVGDVIKITQIRNDEYGKWITHEPDSFSGGGFRWGKKDKGYILDKHFRKATASEIASITSKEEYKVGDWVYVINPGETSRCKLKKGEIVEICKITNQDTNGGYLTTLPLKSDGGEIYISGVRKATPEEIESVTKSEMQELKLKVGKWYTCAEKPNSMICNQDNGKGYGIWTHQWQSSNYWSIGTNSNWRELSDNEVKERLLKYAKEHYPIGTKFKSAYSADHEDTVMTSKYYMWKSLTGVVADSPAGSSVYHDGKWAEIINDEFSLIKDSDIEVGDEVTITNAGNVYNTYDTAFRELNFKNKRRNEASLEDSGTVFHICRHGDFGNTLLAINLYNGKQVLIGKEGVTKKTDNFPPIGTRVRLLEGVSGCKGANGEEGIVVKDASNSGLIDSDKGFNVKIKNGTVWKFNGTWEIISKSDKVKEHPLSNVNYWGIFPSEKYYIGVDPCKEEEKELTKTKVKVQLINVPKI